MSQAVRGTSPLGERHPAATPGLACQALARALSAGDLDAAAACFAPDACLIAPDGTAVHGGAIRARLAGLIQSRAEVAIELAGTLSAGDVAFAYERWAIRSEGVEEFAQGLHPTLVLRRLGAEWKLAIAAPWGWAPAPPLEVVPAPR